MGIRPVGTALQLSSKNRFFGRNFTVAKIAEWVSIHWKAQSPPISNGANRAQKWAGVVKLCASKSYAIGLHSELHSPLHSHHRSDPHGITVCARRDPSYVPHRMPAQPRYNFQTVYAPLKVWWKSTHPIQSYFNFTRMLAKSCALRKFRSNVDVTLRILNLI